ncbi:HIT family protein [Nanoarchaeota archaeon]
MAEEAPQGPAQAGLTEEDLKNMSPEQIMELQKQNCIFCHIINGKVASKKVYDDDRMMGILDINPANPGHVLLLTKEHYSIMPQIPEQDIGSIILAAKKISHAQLKSLNCQGTNLFIANGLVAGQKAQHFMMHVVPRKENDDVKCFGLQRKEINSEKISELKKILVPLINQTMIKFGRTEDDFQDVSESEGELIKEGEEEKEETEKPEKANIEEDSEESTEEENKETEPEKNKEDKGINLDDIGKVLNK